MAIALRPPSCLILSFAVLSRKLMQSQRILPSAAGSTANEAGLFIEENPEKLMIEDHLETNADI